MNKSAKFLTLLVMLVLPVALFAAMSMNMKMPKGTEGTWQGLITGNECAIMNMGCNPAHVKEEIPVFAPKTNSGYDYKQFYYLVALPKGKQEEAFGKDVRIKGTLYKNLSSIWVKSVEIKEGAQWKPFWSMSMDEHKM